MNVPATALPSRVSRWRWLGVLVLAAVLVTAGGCAVPPAPSDGPAESVAPGVVEPPAPKAAEGTRRAHVFVSGRVQGVGFRDFTATHARRLKVTGFVRNLADGRVEAVIEGPAGAVQELLEQMKQGPPAARVERIETSDEPRRTEFEDFRITF